MRIEPIGVRLDRWRRRPRFRAPVSALLLLAAFLAAAVLVSLNHRTGAPPIPPPPAFLAPIVPVPSLPSAPIPVAPAETGCPHGCTEPSAGCGIKGNLSYRTGERIYHLPGQHYYAVTVIDGSTICEPISTSR